MESGGEPNECESLPGGGRSHENIVDSLNAAPQLAERHMDMDCALSRRVVRPRANLTPA